MKTSIKFKHQKIISPLLIAVIFGIIGVSCRKPEIDYREKWVGVYECEYENGGIEENILVDVISIGDSMLNISDRRSYSEWVIVEHDVTVKSDGSFKGEAILQSVDGKFYKDSIYVRVIQASPYHYGYVYYYGKKNK